METTPQEQKTSKRFCSDDIQESSSDHDEFVSKTQVARLMTPLEALPPGHVAMLVERNIIDRRRFDSMSRFCIAVPAQVAENLKAWKPDPEYNVRECNNRQRFTQLKPGAYNLLTEDQREQPKAGVLPPDICALLGCPDLATQEVYLLPGSWFHADHWNQTEFPGYGDEVVYFMCERNLFLMPTRYPMVDASKVDISIMLVHTHLGY